MKIPQFLRKKRNYIWIGLVLVILLIIFLVSGGKNAEIKTVKAQIGNVEQIISATGQISASNKIDLSFASTGKITEIFNKVGDSVYAGKVIARIDSADLFAQLQSAKANVQAMQAKYDQLINGVRQEDISILETNLKNAEALLDSTRIGNTISTSKTALNAVNNALVTLSDLQKKYALNIDSLQNSRILDNKETALFAIYEKNDLRLAEPWYFLALNSGIPYRISQYEKGEKFESFDLLNKMESVLYLTQNALDSLYSGLNIPSATEADKTSVTLAKSSILAQISTINAQKQAIISAQNSVDGFRSQLALKTAPPTKFEVDIAGAQLDQAKAGLAQVQAVIEKNTIRSPINGIIAYSDMTIGEIATPNKVAATVITQNKFQIEANIPEVDVAKIKVGNPVDVTLDAYGPDIKWQAIVAQIYLSEKIVENIPTYKTIITVESSDNRIRSGMTANLDIKNDGKKNVLYLPQRVIIRKDGKKIVRVLLPEDYSGNPRFANASVTTTKDKKNIGEIEVETGLYGSDGRVEITGGVTEGDEIIVE